MVGMGGFEPPSIHYTPSVSKTLLLHTHLKKYLIESSFPVGVGHNTETFTVVHLLLSSMTREVELSPIVSIKLVAIIGIEPIRNPYERFPVLQNNTAV